MTLAFLPHHTWQAGALAFAALMGLEAISYLIKPVGASTAGLNPQTVRLQASLGLLCAIDVGLAAFLVNPESPGDHADSWGGTTGVILLGVWIALVGARPAFRLRAAVVSSRRRR
jgi:hypothetical protein